MAPKVDWLESALRTFCRAFGGINPTYRKRPGAKRTPHFGFRGLGAVAHIRASRVIRPDDVLKRWATTRESFSRNRPNNDFHKFLRWSCPDGDLVKFRPFAFLVDAHD